jgi:hypothetical protein
VNCKDNSSEQPKIGGIERAIYEDIVSKS